MLNKTANFTIFRRSCSFAEVFGVSGYPRVSGGNPDPGAFGIFKMLRLGIFRHFQIPTQISRIKEFLGFPTRDFFGYPIPGLFNFRDFSLKPKIENYDSESPGSGFGIRDPKKYHPEANSA